MKTLFRTEPRVFRPGGLLIAIVAVAMAARVLTAAATSEQDFKLTRDEYPFVDGSTSTQPLGLLIAGRVTRTSVEWHISPMDIGRARRLTFTDAPYIESRTLPLNVPAAVLAARRFSPPLPASIARLAERTPHAGTNQSYAHLADRTADLILVAREPTPDERDAVKRSGADIDVQRIARDAFVFIRNSKNPVTTLTLSQIRDIYAGATTNWSGVGGADFPIAAYQRDASSGSQVEMEHLVMRGRPMPAGPDIRMTFSMFGPFNAVRDNPAGIGYSYHYYERFMAAIPEVKTLSIDGVPADPKTIASGKYPLVTYVYLAHRSDLPAAGNAARLRDWLQTPAGQRVVAESGYVPLR